MTDKLTKLYRNLYARRDMVTYISIIIFIALAVNILFFGGVYVVSTLTN